MNTFLYAAAAGGNNMIMIFAFLLLIGFSYYTILRPQKKQSQKHLEMMSALKKGDSVVLISGLHGKIDEINEAENTVVIDADGIYLTFNKTAIRNIIPTVTTTPVTAQTDTDSAISEETDASPVDDESEENKD